MVGSYCVHRVELDTEPDETLAHAWAQKEDHKYVARVNIKNPKDPKRKWLYFYSKERYQAYLNREAKPGDKIILPSGKTGVVGRDVQSPSTMNRGQKQVTKNGPTPRDTATRTTTTATKPKSVDKGRSLLSRLFGIGDAITNSKNPKTESTGASAISRIFGKLAEYRKRRQESEESEKSGGDSLSGLAAAAKAKAEATKKAQADQRAAAEADLAAKRAARAAKETNKAPTASKTDEEEKKSKGSGGGGGGSGGGSGKGSGGGGSGKGSGGSGKGSGDSDNATSFGSVSKLPKLKGDHDPDRDMQAVGASDYDSTNCVAYDLRRRGFEVTPSLKANAGDIKALASLYKGAKVAKETNYNRLIAKLSKLKRGCRGMMQFGGRMVMWSVEKQGVVFRDCTNGKLLNQNRMYEKGPFQMIRTDNCEPNTNILRSVRARS